MFPSGCWPWSAALSTAPAGRCAGTASWSTASTGKASKVPGCEPPVDGPRPSAPHLAHEARDEERREQLRREGRGVADVPAADALSPAHAGAAAVRSVDA